MHLQLGNSCLGLKYAREGCRKAKSAGSMLVEARAIRQYAYCCVSVGDYARSTTLCAEARVVLDTLGMCDVRNAIHRNFLDLQAQTHHLQTYYALSRQLNAALIGVPRDQRTEEKVSEAYARINVASSDIRMGRCTDPSVRRNIDVARGLMAGTSNRLGLPTCDFALADLYFHQGNYRESGSLYEQCLPIIDIQGQSAELELVCREKLADIAFAEKDTRRAEQLSFVLLILALRVRNSAATHQALRRIGDIFRSAGDFGTGETLFELALSGFTLMDIHQARRDCLIRLGDIHQMRGEGERARTKWSQARFLFDRSSQLGDVRNCEERLVTEF
ncbi:hypothetical protein C8R43DRAFT_475985 [Mycena crocata]|nr:hypothetical protein C8R43DRAFT_475985 [Mycena crocata]